MGRAKSPNGHGEGFTALISFNPADPNDIRAREMWLQLSSQKKFSAVVKAMLNALMDYQEQTGIVMTAERAMGVMMSASLFGMGHPSILVGQGMSEDEELIISSAEKGGIDEVLGHFASNIKLDDDDLWDD